MKIQLSPLVFQIRAAWKRTMSAMDAFTAVGAEVVRLIEQAALVLITTDPMGALRLALLASELRREVKP